MIRLVAIALFLAGCATLETRIEGTSGPVAWRVADLAVVTEDVQGQPVDSTAFTLRIRNVSDRTVTFTKMDRTVYRPGVDPSSTSHTGRWALRPGVEWKVPFSSSLICRDPSGCAGSGATQPLWQILLTGDDDQHRPVHVRIDVVLPPQAEGSTPIVR